MAPFKMHHERMGSRCSGRLLSRTQLFLDGAQPGYKASPNFSSQHIWAGRKTEKHRSRVCWDWNNSVSAWRLATYRGPWELQLWCRKSRTGPRGAAGKPHSPKPHSPRLGSAGAPGGSALRDDAWHTLAPHVPRPHFLPSRPLSHLWQKGRDL